MDGFHINTMMYLHHKAHHSMIHFSKKLIIGTIHTVHLSYIQAEVQILTKEPWTLQNIDKIVIQENGNHQQKDNDHI